MNLRSSVERRLGLEVAEAASIALEAGAVIQAVRADGFTCGKKGFENYLPFPTPVTIINVNDPFYTSQGLLHVLSSAT